VDRQKEITHAVLMAQEEERADIGRELHDNINQILGAAKMYIELAKTDEELLQTCLDKSSEYIVNVISEIRMISKRLAIPTLQVMGLTDSIKILLDDMKIIFPTKFEFNSDFIDKNDISEKLQQHIFRVVQEQVTNIIKHADASHATISLKKDLTEITLIISDNGKGDDLTQPKKGVGIINITGRVELCDGTLTIKSKPGEGYGLKAVFPLNDNQQYLK
jgi:signal transduction histidine kinase